MLLHSVVNFQLLLVLFAATCIIIVISDSTAAADEHAQLDAARLHADVCATALQLATKGQTCVLSHIALMFLSSFCNNQF